MAEGHCPVTACARPGGTLASSRGLGARGLGVCGVGFRVQVFGSSGRGSAGLGILTSGFGALGV